MRPRLHAAYVNAAGQWLVPQAFDTRAGAVNERVVARNLSTGQEETWSVRLFMAEHVRFRQPLRSDDDYYNRADSEGR